MDDPSLLRLHGIIDENANKEIIMRGLDRLRKIDEDMLNMLELEDEMILEYRAT